MPIFIPKSLAPPLKIFSCLPSFQNRNLKARMLEHGTVYAIKLAWLQSFLSLLPFKLWWYIHFAWTADSDFSCHFIFYKVFTEFFTLSSFFFFLMLWVLWPGAVLDLNFPTRIEPESPALEGQVLNMGLPGKCLPVILDWYNNGSEKKTGKLDNHALVSSPILYSRNFYICLGVFVHSLWTLEACSIQLAGTRAGPSWFSCSEDIAKVFWGQELCHMPAWYTFEFVPPVVIKEG